MPKYTVDENFDLGPILELCPKAPKWSYIWKYNSSFSFWAKIMQFSECTPLTMPQNIVGPEFWFMAPFGVHRAPKWAQNKVYNANIALDIMSHFQIFLNFENPTRNDHPTAVLLFMNKNCILVPGAGARGRWGAGALRREFMSAWALRR